MALFTSILVFLLVASGLYLVMRRHIYEVLLGVILLGHGVNVFMIAMGGWSDETKPPILINGEATAYADALPQALILTAIVIGFAVTAFMVVLILRGYEVTGTVEVGEQGREEGEA
ncbi:MAG: Na+/H+ antiporter subunit C [Candidatus Sumerlaeia bacterium]|nr:Na+/H+ antiporter subunit C [Candidatus Sumerlaeia bacterium]